MAATNVALGTLVRVDHDGGTTYATVGRVKGMTPVGQQGTEADGKELDDTLDVPIPGIEGPSEFTFTQYWYPGDTAGTKFDTSFTNRHLASGSGGGVIGVQLAYPHDGIASTDDMPTQVFDARVISIGHTTQDEPNSVFMRDITLRRITAITESTYTVP
jgi:hypothetical protein|tara:strand:+ start:5445 stop:5921 length:477 start_codon:yes stop_codon:yes gene_type:complete